MAEYSIATAKNQLPRLIDQMLDGEPVVITRRGRPVARVVPIDSVTTSPPHRIDLGWLKSVRDASKTEISGHTDTVKTMRDDYRY